MYVSIRRPVAGIIILCIAQKYIILTVLMIWEGAIVTTMLILKRWIWVKSSMIGIPCCIAIIRTDTKTLNTRRSKMNIWVWLLHFDRRDATKVIFSNPHLLLISNIATLDVVKLPHRVLTILKKVAASSSLVLASIAFQRRRISLLLFLVA